MSKTTISTLLMMLALIVFVIQPLLAEESAWVHYGADGHLVYRKTADGDRIMDFSTAGYGGGGVALPQCKVQATLSSSGGDDSVAIQAAIDTVSRLPAQDGLRGAVLLKAGVFHVRTTVTLAAGVVLRGEGNGDNQTVFLLTEAPHIGILMGKPLSSRPSGSPIPVSDHYIPSGTDSVHVADASGFRRGDRVQITAPVTPAWLRFMGMDHLVRNGKHETWISGALSVVRTVAGVEGKTIRFTVPLSNSYNADYLGTGGVKIGKIIETDLSEQIGIEALRIVAPVRQVTLSDSLFSGISIKGTQNAWVRDVTLTETANDVMVDRNTRQVTFERVSVLHSTPIVGAALPSAFSISGTQILMDHCSVKGDKNWFVTTNRDVQGPNVVLHCRFEGDGAVEPHQRWATGVLIDSVEVPGGGISMQNRGTMGSGHGWTVGWGVSWNNRAAWFLIQNPPGALNWSIGDQGAQLRAAMPGRPIKAGGALEPQGMLDHAGLPVEPSSLYLAQLKERLGARALKAIGY